jgi:hypothetical protein
VLGVAQKAWFLDRLAKSTATWKVWGNSFPTVDGRTDLQNLPAGLGAGVAGRRLRLDGRRRLDRVPHRARRDLGGHGYAVVRLDAKALEAEFVCIPRPLERAERPDGGPLV